MAVADDPFEDVLNLEEQFYQAGYKQGQADGVRAGRTEGRQLGLEKGFQKFVESGRLCGRAVVWANRLPAASSNDAVPPSSAKPAAAAQSGGDGNRQCSSLPRLPNNPRLQKNIVTLYALVETDTLSTDNTDEAVNDFDDRVKRAQGKARVIERIVGEGAAKGKPPAAGSSATPSGSKSPTADAM